MSLSLVEIFLFFINSVPKLAFNSFRRDKSSTLLIFFEITISVIFAIYTFSSPNYCTIVPLSALKISEINFAGNSSEPIFISDSFIVKL